MGGRCPERLHAEVPLRLGLAGLFFSLFVGEAEFHLLQPDLFQGIGNLVEAPLRREQEAIGRTVPTDSARRAQVEACVEEMRRLWNAPGFLRPDPAPPVVIAAFGPKMAELAGRVGDGINVPALHPRLRELVAIARDAC